MKKRLYLPYLAVIMMMNVAPTSMWAAERAQQSKAKLIAKAQSAFSTLKEDMSCLFSLKKRCTREQKKRIAIAAAAVATTVVLLAAAIGIGVVVMKRKKAEEAGREAERERAEEARRAAEQAEAERLRQEAARREAEAAILAQEQAEAEARLEGERAEEARRAAEDARLAEERAERQRQEKARAAEAARRAAEQQEERRAQEEAEQAERERLAQEEAERRAAEQAEQVETASREEMATQEQERLERERAEEARRASERAEQAAAAEPERRDPAQVPSLRPDAYPAAMPAAPGAEVGVEEARRMMDQKYQALEKSFQDFKSGFTDRDLFKIVRGSAEIKEELGDAIQRYGINELGREWVDSLEARMSHIEHLIELRRSFARGEAGPGEQEEVERKLQRSKAALEAQKIRWMLKPLSYSITNQELLVRAQELRDSIVMVLDKMARVKSDEEIREVEELLEEIYKLRSDIGSARFRASQEFQRLPLHSPERIAAREIYGLIEKLLEQYNRFLKTVESIQSAQREKQERLEGLVGEEVYVGLRGLIENYGLEGIFSKVPSAGDVRWWHVLGFDSEQDKATAKRAYRTLAGKVHPDKHPGSEKVYNPIFQYVKRAYEESQQ